MRIRQPEDEKVSFGSAAAQRVLAYVDERDKRAPFSQLSVRFDLESVRSGEQVVGLLRLRTRRAFELLDQLVDLGEKQAVLFVL